MLRAMIFRFLLPLSLSLVFLPACNKAKYQYETTAPAYAGKAEVRMKADKTGNGEMTLAFEHLAPPKKIDSALSAYVVWMQIEGKDPAKLGILEYDAKKRTGELSVTYSAVQMKIIVTLENDPGTLAPTGARVLDVDITTPEG